MNSHLSDAQVSRLLAGALPPDQLVRAEAHLWYCPDCRDALRRRTEPAPDLPPLSAPRPADDTPAPDGPLDAPPVVPGYEVLGELGRGGMGVVFEARQLRPSRTVALKLLRAGLPADADARRRFRAEAEALARLQHPGIVQVHEVGELDGRPYFSLEFCAGGSLARRLAGAPLPPGEAAALVEAVARAVGAAHRADIVHRDLKPANILLQAPGLQPGGLAIPKVSDFGLAKCLTDDSSHLTQSCVVLGTPSYAAPEQVGGTAGPAADIYSLGAILYECLTGRPPFKAATVLETLELARTRDPLPVRPQQPGVPADLETICLKCLEKEPARRYGSADELADDLRRFQQGRPVAARPVSRPERLWRWARRNPLPAVLSAVLALAVTAGLASALALWRDADGHWRREETARREAEDNYLACRQLLGEYVAVTRDSRLRSPAARQAQREQLLKARTFCDGLRRRRPDDAGLQRDLAEICTALAALDAHDGRLEEAREEGDTAWAIWRKMSEERPGAYSSDRLAAVLGVLGEVYVRIGRTTDAEASLRKALALWDQLAGEVAAPTASQLAACAAARRELAALISNQGRHREQCCLYEENCARLARANAGPQASPELCLALLVNLTELGALYQHDGNKDGAEHCWRQGHELGLRLVDDVPDSGLAVYYLASCGRELFAKDPAAAPPEETAALCARAARLLEAQRKRDPADEDTTHVLVDVYWLMADSYWQAGNPSEALRTARRSVEVLGELADHRAGDPAVRLDMLVAYAKLAVRERQWGDPSAAQSSARRAADGFEEFCHARSANPQALALVGRYGANLAPPLRHAEAPDDSQRVAECCRRLFEELVRTEPGEPNHHLGLVEAWTQIGKIHWRKGRLAETEAALRAAVKAAGELGERWPEYRPVREQRLRRLGRFLEERGRTAEAAACRQGIE
jgi:tetratricopeptide (TPR) repeat protein